MPGSDIETSEIYPNPTVKTVVFQIRFPNLFYIENRIGDFQLRIINEFPNSAIVYQRNPLFIDFGIEGKIGDFQRESEDPRIKFWQFQSPKKYELNVFTNSLAITSNFHKTYANTTSDVRFRDIINIVLSPFFEIMQIPFISRVGLRYIDECPIFSKTNESFEKYYNSTFPLDIFNISDSDEMKFKVITKKGDYKLRYEESLVKIGENYKLILDFDGFCSDIRSDKVMSTTDDLYRIIRDEYFERVKSPLVEYMRTGEEPRE